MYSTIGKIAIIALVLAYIIALYYVISAEMIEAWRLFEITFIIAIFVILFIKRDERRIRWWLFRIALMLLLVAIYLLFRAF